MIKRVERLKNISSESFFVSGLELESSNPSFMHLTNFRSLMNRAPRLTKQ